MKEKQQADCVQQSQGRPMYGRCRFGDGVGKQERISNHRTSAPGLVRLPRRGVAVLLVSQDRVARRCLHDGRRAGLESRRAIKQTLASCNVIAEQLGAGAICYRLTATLFA